MEAAALVPASYPPYTNPLHSNPWATLSGSSAAAAAAAPATLSPTAEIDPLLTYLSTTLGFLSRALASAPLRRIARAVLTTVSDTLWSHVLSSHRFSTAGAAQFAADLAAVCRIVNTTVGAGVAESGLRKCLEGAQLVGLPVKGAAARPFPSDAQDAGAGGDDDDWDAWDAGDDGPPKANPPQTEAPSLSADDVDPGLGLWEVERRLFADNQSARDVLDELGSEMLTETEARALLRQRVELAG